MRWRVRDIDRAGWVAMTVLVALALVLLVRPSGLVPSATSATPPATEAVVQSAPTATQTPAAGDRAAGEERERSRTVGQKQPRTGTGDPGPQAISAAEARALVAGVRAAQDAAAVPTTFRISTFNVLGHGHTAPGGDRKGWASGTTRMRWSVQLLNAARIDVVGFQEFQGPQYQEFERVAGATWDVFPGMSMGSRPVQNSIAWRSDVWQLMHADTVSVPYFFGRPMPMPYVQLRNRTTGQLVWVLNIHNPADKFGNAGQWRARALEIETSLVNQLHGDGTPVLFTGDFNDRVPAFCGVVMQAPMGAADGGSNDAGCVPPRDPAIDWIFGTDNVAFSDYVRDRSAFVRRTTDHPFIHATATVLPQ